MKLYDTYQGLIIFSLVFMLFIVEIMYSCSCKDPSKTRCVRHEFYGVQLNHFGLFLFLGFVFPSYFYTLQILGVLFEIAEGILDHHDEFVVNYVGGCLMERPTNQPESSLANTVVFKNEEKYLNPIDRWFGIQNSKIHGWHGSAGEVVMNFLGFVAGYGLNKLIMT
jgi:hypothetical protein